MNPPTTSRRWPRAAAITTAVVTSLMLTGCAQQTSTGTTETATPETIATPTQILTPAPREACSAQITSSTDEKAAPDRATVTCGEITRTVAGDFRPRYTNSYDPGATGGVQQVIAVGDEVRVWIRDGEGTCLVLTTPENPTVECKPSGGQATPRPEPGDGHTVVPEDQATTGV